MEIFEIVLADGDLHLIVRPKTNFDRKKTMSEDPWAIGDY